MGFAINTCIRLINCIPSSPSICMFSGSKVIVLYQISNRPLSELERKGFFPVRHSNRTTPNEKISERLSISVFLY